MIEFFSYYFLNNFLNKAFFRVAIDLVFNNWCLKIANVVIRDFLFLMATFIAKQRILLPVKIL